MMWWNNGIGWGGWIVMILDVVAVWALVAFASIAVIRGIRNGGSGTLPERDASQLLDERFARGEIGINEYCDRQDAPHDPLDARLRAATMATPTLGRGGRHAHV